MLTFRTAPNNLAYVVASFNVIGYVTDSTEMINGKIKVRMRKL